MSVPGIGPITAVGDRNAGAFSGELYEGPGFLGLARAGAAPAFDRRQDPARPDIEDGSARPEAPADHRRDLGDPGGGAGRRGAGSWLARMLTRKPKMLVAVALANKMARTAWALMTRGGAYETPARA